MSKKREFMNEMREKLIATLNIENKYDDLWFMFGDDEVEIEIYERTDGEVAIEVSELFYDHDLNEHISYPVATDLNYDGAVMEVRKIKKSKRG